LGLLAEGRIDVKSMITHKFPLEKIDESFDTTANRGRSEAVKVLVTP
jgi:L-iditol 2-dehydrogenase